jgi:16S rRNA (uracil1498-N3)-methyltransferase
MPHCIFQPHTTPTPGEILTVSGPEAHHAVRVKRLEVADTLHILTGAGHRAVCSITTITKPRGEWQLTLTVQAVTLDPPTAPRLLVCSAVPKGDALEQMIDGLSQAGAAAWSPLTCERTVVDPRDAKLARLTRVCEESLKQSARAWLMAVEPALTFADALKLPNVIVADATGEPYAPTTSATSDQPLTLLIGPEGGLTPGELAAARASRARICTFGVHIMRIEVAAVVAAGCILSPRPRA